MKTIKLNDYELNLLHGLLVDEEIRLKKAYKILSENGDNFANTNNYIEEVNKLRMRLTNIDDTEDYFEVFDRIEDYSLDVKKRGGRMKVKDLIMELIYVDPYAEVTCVTYENEDLDAEEFALNIRTLEDYEDNVDLVLDNLDISKNDYNRTFDNLRNKVLNWGKSKDLIQYENADKQFLKFMEEVFEFRDEWLLYTHEYNKSGYIEGNNHLAVGKHLYDMKMEMGDIFVTLIILCAQLDIYPVDCLTMAYEKIKDRTGKTINGVFIKEEDLKGDLK